MFRRGAAAAADQIDQAALGKFTQYFGHVFGGFIITTKRIGQAGVGVTADIGVGHLRQHIHMLTQVFGTQCAIQTNGEWLHMSQGIPERLGSLPGQGAAGGIGNRARDHHWQAGAEFVEHIINGKQRSLGIEGVKHGFHHQYIGTAFDQAACRFSVGLGQFVEGDGTKARAVHIRRQ